MRHQQRPSVLGVDPRLVLVFELGASVDADEFRRAGLRVVDSSDRRLVVAFADDPELATFMGRLEAMAGGTGWARAMGYIREYRDQFGPWFEINEDINFAVQPDTLDTLWNR